MASAIPKPAEVSTAQRIDYPPGVIEEAERTFDCSDGGNPENGDWGAWPRHLAEIAAKHNQQRE